MSRSIILASDGRGAGLERRASEVRGLKCAWCGQTRRTLFIYQSLGRSPLIGLSGEGRPFCNIDCFRSFQ